MKNIFDNMINTYSTDALYVNYKFEKQYVIYNDIEYWQTIVKKEFNTWQTTVTSSLQEYKQKEPIYMYKIIDFTDILNDMHPIYLENKQKLERKLKEAIPKKIAQNQ